MNICEHCGTEMKDVLAPCSSCGESGAVLYNYTVPVEKASDARKNMMAKWLAFNGRSRRNEFWKAALLNTLYIFGLVALAIALIWIMWSPTMKGLAESKKVTDMDVCSFIFMGCSTLLIAFVVFRNVVGQVSMTVRRLHDLGQSGWLMLLSVIPSVVYAVMKIWVLFVDSTLVFSDGFSGVMSVIGPLALITNAILFVILMLDSRPGNNKYGTNPKDIYVVKKETKKIWA